MVGWTSCQNWSFACVWLLPTNTQSRNLTRVSNHGARYIFISYVHLEVELHTHVHTQSYEERSLCHSDREMSREREWKFNSPDRTAHLPNTAQNNSDWSGHESYSNLRGELKRYIQLVCLLQGQQLMNSASNLSIPGQPFCFCIKQWNNRLSDTCLFNSICGVFVADAVWGELSSRFASRKGPSLSTTTGPFERHAGRPKSGHRQGAAPFTLLSEERANKTGCLPFHLGLVWGGGGGCCIR